MPKRPWTEDQPDPDPRNIRVTQDALDVLSERARPRRRTSAEQDQSALNASGSRAVSVDSPALPTPGPSRVGTLSPETVRFAQRARMIQETTSESIDAADMGATVPSPIPAPNFGVSAYQHRTPPTTPRRQASSQNLPPVPIPAPNFGPPKEVNTTRSPTERSPIPPTTRRSLTYPSMGNTPGFKFIGFSPEVQVLMNRHQLSWAAQYEIARYRSQSKKYRLTLDEYDHIFRELEGPNDKAWHVASLLRSCIREHQDPDVRDPVLEAHRDSVKHRIEELERPQPDHDPYLHLEKEEKCISDNLGAGLGLSSHGPEPGYYGGQVMQIATLVENEKRGGFTTDDKRSLELVVVLQRHKVGRSTRVARNFGSRRLLQVTLPPVLVRRSSKRILEFFSNKFVLNGRIFEPVEAKDHTIYLLETSDYDDSGSGLATWSHLSSNGRKSLLEFMQWHNPIAVNRDQSSSKWAARFNLAFSTSVPACRFDIKDIFEIPDIVNWAFSGAPPSRCIMTDGCGFMNKAVALHVQRLLDLKYLPTAVQARIAGVKGMFLLRPDDDTIDRPILWCRPSQIKIRRGGGRFLSEDPSQLILDLLRPPRPKQPAHLSKEVITCLAFGGVSADDLERIFLDALEEQFNQLATWDGPQAEIKLWIAVFELEHVLMGRLRRETAGASRVWGFGEDTGPVEAELGFDSDDEDDMSDRSVASSPNLFSGFPSSLAEQVLSLLSAGFRPGTTPLLKHTLEVLIGSIIKQFVQKYRVAIPHSLESFAVPDPTGQLEEGEIYFRGTEQWQDTTGMWRETLVGDVLAARYPCKVASDVQKLRAVDCPALREWTNVIVFSTKGPRSPMSLLGGGDYDGDTVTIIWDSIIVDAFNNAPLIADGLCQGDTPEGFIGTNFNKSSMKVSEMMRSAVGNPGKLVKDLQQALLAPIAHESTVGRYSVLHEKASFTFGYNDPATIRLAHMFCACLDGLKGGISVKKEIRDADCSRFDCYQLPQSRGGQTGYTESAHASPRKKALRPQSLGKDIIDRLWGAGQDAQAIYMAQVHGRPDRCHDPDLRQPYEEVLQRIETLSSTDASTLLRSDLDRIKLAVQNARDEWKTRRKDNGRFHKLPVSERQDILRNISADLYARLDVIEPGILSRSDVTRTAGSYAYCLDMAIYNVEHPRYQNKGTHFPFEIMFRELAEIKARSTGRGVSITSQFADRFVVHRSFLRVLGTGH